MQNDLVKEIISKKIKCIFLSPHNDDAILSCGGLLLQIAGKTDITIINVFTSAHDKPYTLSAKQFLKASGNLDALALYNERKREDKKVFSSIAVHIIDLGLEDALFRKRKKHTLFGKILTEFDHIYPTYRWHVTKKIAKDDYAVTELKNELMQYKNENAFVFAPYGIGNHVDHVIVRNVCEKMFKHLFIYSDYPYNERLNQQGEAFQHGKIYKVHPDVPAKTKLIKGYKTQFLGLFPNGHVADHQEIYFSTK